jgi:NAD(P)H-flavin reductase
MKNLVLLIVLCVSNFAVAQVYGEIFMDKREIVKDIDYTVNYSKEGKLVFDIKVNTDGKVTSCFINEDKSTITAKGPMMKAKSKIMGQLVFGKGIGLPQFHSGYVQITTTQGENTEEDNRFKPPY